MIVYILFAKSKNTMMQCIEWFTNNNYNILDLEVTHNNYKFQVADVKSDLIQISILSESLTEQSLQNKAAFAQIN